MKWKPQTLQLTSTDDVKYQRVSATQNYTSNLCNPKEIASTLSSKACGDQREYVSNMPSKSMPIDLAHVIKNDDHTSTREEKEQHQHCVVSKGDTIRDNIDLVCIDDKVDEDLVSARLVKKLRFKTEWPTRHYRVNWIHQDGSNCQEIDRCTVKFPIGRIYFDRVFSDVVNTTTC